MILSQNKSRFRVFRLRPRVKFRAVRLARQGSNFIGFISPDGVAWTQVQDAGRALARAAPPARGVKVWGPTPAFYHLLRGQTRERLLVQAERNVDVQAYLRAWLESVKISGKVRVTVDVDPVSFF